MYDYIIVGSGLYGAVFAQKARENGRSVLVIEKRGHIAGNCHSVHFEDTGIILHKYGTHIFHCADKRVWDYVNRFSEFNRYQHRVLTTHKDKVYPMPICLGTINAFYGLNLKPREVDAFIESKRERIENPQNLEEKAISLIGRDLYEAFIKGYTIKQWGCDPTELPASIINRLPVRRSYHDSYFDDPYQGLPVDGYTPMIERMFEGVEIERNVDFFDDPEYWRKKCNTLVFTGPIDRYFDYCHGRLGWRSVRFDTERVDVEDFQGTSVMNYADVEVPFTRIHEPRHLHLERQKECKPDTSVIVREYPQVDEEAPYYPINSEKDRAMLAKYLKLTDAEPKVVFGGRLAEYRYYDMHHAIDAALSKADEVLK